MKKCSMWVVAALSAMMVMFTSCLDGGSNEVQGSASGVVTRSASTGYQPVLNTGSAPVYFPELDDQSAYPDGTCMAVNIFIDYSLPENADWASRGFITASLMDTPQVIEKGTVSEIRYERDTTDLDESGNEVLLSSGFAPSVYTNYVNGWLMFASNVRIGSRQIAEWKVYYPQNPTVTATSQGINCYDFYIRATIEGDETGATVSSVLNAYYLKSILDRINSMERNEGNEMFNIRFKFAKDTAENKITEWNISNPITIPVTQQ